MVQTIKVNSDFTFEVNFGSYSVNSNLSDLDIPKDFIAKLQDIHDNLIAFGGSEVHSERNTFHSFEHIIKGGEVLNEGFGSLISTQNFDWIMAQSDAVELALDPPPPPPAPEVSE